MLNWLEFLYSGEFKENMKKPFTWKSKSKVEESADKMDSKTENDSVLNVNQDSNIENYNYASNAFNEGLIVELIQIIYYIVYDCIVSFILTLLCFKIEHFILTMTTIGSTQLSFKTF